MERSALLLFGLNVVSFYSKINKFQKQTKLQVNVAAFFRLCLGGSLLLGDLVLLHRTHEALLLLGGLESAVAELGRCVDELERDLLEGDTLDLLDQRFAQGDRSLLGAHAAALDHDEIVADFTVLREATLFERK